MPFKKLSPKNSTRMPTMATSAILISFVSFIFYFLSVRTCDLFIFMGFKRAYRLIDVAFLPCDKRHDKGIGETL